jgi:enoyl-CoA hydratase/carnithine racemase
MLCQAATLIGADRRRGVVRSGTPTAGVGFSAGGDIHAVAPRKPDHNSDERNFHAGG